ncbi:MAG: SPFH/Band 7/PHB domain protein [Thermoleophilia bacterium]|nr:SPFH/Band 7/PHB domain protein [Thermoleophilia bacterium]
MGSVIAVGVIALAALFVISAGLKIVPQAQAAIVERLGRYRRTLEPGLHLLIPFADRIRANVDLREQVQSFPPQPVITEDNLVVNIDSVVYFQVTEARAAVYEIENFIQGIEQITVTTLRNVIGGMSLERTLTSRDDINQQLRGVLDEATGRWGIRVNRVELKSIDPPATIQQAMETQMRADRDKRAAILKAEGEKQSQILTAEGEQQSQVLRAQGERDAEVLRAEGQARAIETVFRAIHEGRPDSELLAYQYLQALPKIAEGSSNKMWIVPSDFAQTLGSVAPMLGAITQAAQEGGPSKSAPPRGDDDGGTPALPPGNAPY